MLIDETWTKTNMAPLRGWAARGERLIGHAPFGHWNTMTFVAALRHGGIVAPWVIDGPIGTVMTLSGVITSALSYHHWGGQTVSVLLASISSAT